ncbi:MAG: GerMN domain-containing protein [Lachnospiraceae bacterium]|nr:GerMN domain-containing protein [Lachnospiraceae bacterium]
MKKRVPALILLLALLAGCAKEEAPAVLEDGGFQVYYVSNDEAEIIAAAYEPACDPADTQAAVAEFTAQLETIPSMLEYEAPISGKIELLDWTLQEQLLTLNFSEYYAEVDATKEILTRAAIVRTLSQIPGIENIAFQVEGVPLTDAQGEVVGNMTADTFIYNAGREINTYEKVQLTLFFADGTGAKLLPVYRTVVYNSNILMERLIVEQLIAGPKTDGNDLGFYPTLNPACGIANISVRDGICYVSLDENFMVQTNPVTPQATIYSIVNSLAELPEVSRVQISVQGDTSMDFMDAMPLSAMYTRNLDIVRSFN